METINAMPRIPEWDNLEICEQALATPRKRQQFLKGLMAASAGLAAAAAVGPAAALASTARGSAAVPQGDIDILNFALTLEWLERTFYEQAMLHVPFKQSNVRRLAQTLRGDEITHTVALTAAVKGASTAPPVGRAPHYNFPAGVFGSQAAFLGLSEALEDTGVHAYLGQAGNIMTPSILLTAATIVTVEARHAGAIRYQNGKAPTSSPFDTGFTKAQVLAVAGPLIGS